MATQAQMPPAASAVSREGMFSAVTAVPEMLRGILSPGAAVPTPNVSLHRLTLSFWEKDARCSPLEVAFQRRQAERYHLPLRVLTVIFLVVNIALVAYDYQRFMKPNVAACQNTLAFEWSLGLRLGIMVPACVAVLVYTGTPWYRRSAQPLAAFMAVLGGYIVAYSVIGKDPGYGTLALLIVYLFSFTPISFWLNSLLCILLNVAFGIGLYFTPLASQSCTPGQAALNSSSKRYVGFDIMGVLIAFTLIVGFMGHNLEYWLRASFLDEYRLQIETDKLRAEKALSQSLLVSMLPSTVIAELQRGRPLIADTVDEVTVLFCELKFNFYTHDPQTVVRVLNLVYSAFDALLDVTRVHKIETVGEVYLCVGGCPVKSPNHAAQAAEMALGMMACLPELRRRIATEIGLHDEEIDIRVGLNSGPVAAGVVGIKNPRYKLIGDTVNTASRMESTSLPGRIQLTAACKQALEKCAPRRYVIVERGEIPVKGKGTMITYWLLGRTGEPVYAAGRPGDSARSYGGPVLPVTPLPATPAASAAPLVRTASGVSAAGVSAIRSPAAGHSRPGLTLAAVVKLGGHGAGGAAMALSLARSMGAARRLSQQLGKSPGQRADGGRASGTRFFGAVVKATGLADNGAESDEDGVGHESDDGDGETGASDDDDDALCAYFDSVNGERNVRRRSRRDSALPSGSDADTDERGSAAARELKSSSTRVVLPNSRHASGPEPRDAIADVSVVVETHDTRSFPVPRGSGLVVHPTTNERPPDSAGTGSQTTDASKIRPPPLPLADLHAGLSPPTGLAKPAPKLAPGAARLKLARSARSIAFGVKMGASARRPRKKADQKQLVWHDYLALCLNRPIDDSDAAPWERTFQSDSASGWRRFLRISLILALVVLALFLLSDYANSIYGSSTFSMILIVRYGVAAPVLLAMLGVTFLPLYRQSWAFTQSTTALAVMIIGATIIAISVLGGQPGYGVLALYVVYCLNFSILALALRIMSLVVLVVSFTVASNVASSNTDENATGIFFIYLMAFTIGESIPVVMRERAVRENYFRQWRIEIEKRKLADEQARSSKLLENLLPAVIVARLRLGNRQLIADKFDEVTILWTDMKGFTDFSSARTPLEVVAFLNAMFSTFDRILDKYGIRKVEVLGDAFFVVGGCPVPSDDHAERCANAAIEMLMHMPVLRRFAGADINMRIGLHTGPVVAGVVGLRDPRYHLFGATPPYANAMESHGVPGRIHCSAETFAKLRDRQIERANAFVDYRRVGGSSLTRGGVAASIIRGRSIQTLEASSSRGRYPRVSLELLDDFVRWKKAASGTANSSAPQQVTRAGVSVIATSRSAAGDMMSHSSTPSRSSRPSLQAAVVATPHMVPETGEGSVRSQVQLWQESTFMGWDIRGCMVQNGLLYANLPEVAGAIADAVGSTTPPATAATPVPHGGGGGFFGLQSKKLPQPPVAAAARTLHTASGMDGAVQAGGDGFTPPATGSEDACLDIFVPADPGSRFFGPGAGFFAFEARPDIEIKGRGVQTTYFLSRADPPLVPELAQSLEKLQHDLEDWQATYGRAKGVGPPPQRSSSEPSGASASVAPRLGPHHHLRAPPPVVTGRVSEMETERPLRSARSNGQMSLGGVSVQSSPHQSNGGLRRAELRTPPLGGTPIPLQRPAHVLLDSYDGGRGTPAAPVPSAAATPLAGEGRGRLSIIRPPGMSAVAADAGLREGYDDRGCDAAESTDWSGGGGASVARNILRAPPATVALAVSSGGGGLRAAGGTALGRPGSIGFAGSSSPAVGTGPGVMTSPGGGVARRTAASAVASPQQPPLLLPGQRPRDQLVTTARADDFTAAAGASDPAAPVTRAPSSPPGLLSVQSFRV